MIEEVINVIVEALRNGNKLLFIGNGGSASQAEHLAAEFVGSGYPAIALTEVAIITAIANDHGYSSIFSRQIKTSSNFGDVLIALSTSGESINVVVGCLAAKKKKCVTVALTRIDSTLADIVDYPIIIDASGKNETQIIQEKTIEIGHKIWQEVIRELEGKI